MKYICTICGYIYDDEQSDVPFDKLPDSWTCPVCTAPKALFEPLEESPPRQKTTEAAVPEPVEDMRELGAGELSALFSNLARGCEKQYQQEAMKAFQQIADYFCTVTPAVDSPDIERLSRLIIDDLDSGYDSLRARAQANGDRGTLRIVTWGEKVTRMAKSLIERYISEGEKFLENTGLYVCTVCGFLYLGDEPPRLCPVCKVPGWKFEKIDGRVKK